LIFGLEIGDPEVAEFIEQSDEVGPALQTAGCSPFGIVGAGGDPSRLLVSVTKFNPCPGNRITAPGQSVISMSFRVEPEATTTIRLAGQSPTAEPIAYDSENTTIPSVVFDTAAARLSGR
jgi:hypothetical protein